ncbi:MAG: hypothetical protein WC514_03035 [Candidatus Paceibacterota bacterium]
MSSEKLKLFKNGDRPKYKIRETGEEVNFEELQKIILIYQERLKKLSEVTELTDFFFKKKLDYDKDLLKWDDMTDKDISHSLSESEKILSRIKTDEWKKENIEKVLLEETEKAGDRGKLLWPLRVALSGKQASAGPFDIADILGREKTLKRIKEAKSIL